MRAAFSALVVFVLIAACAGDPFVAFDSAGREPSATGDGKEGGRNNGFASGGRMGGAGASTEAAGGGLGGSAAPTEPEAALAGAGGAESAEGGAPPTSDCRRAASPDWELGYFPELRGATTHESHPFFRVINRGELTTLDRIALRYYFTKESDLPETGICYWVTGDRCALAKIEFGDIAMPMPKASRYLQVSFPGASGVLVSAESLEVRVGFKTGSETLVQSNDYSFDPDANAPSSATPFPYKSWPQATLHVDGVPVWGGEPCSTVGLGLAR